MKIRILSLLLLFNSLCAYSQSKVLFQSDQKKSYLVNYSNTYEENQVVINDMLESIAKFIPKPVNQAKFTISFDESIKIIRDKNAVTIFVDFQNVVLNGDLTYKGFDMSDVLIPAKYEFTATLFRDKNTLITNLTQQKTPFKLNYNEAVLNYTDTSHNSNYKLAIENLKFIYDKGSAKRFHEKTDLVEQYFMSVKDIHHIGRQLSELNPNAIDNLDYTEQRLDEIKLKLDDISSAMFWQALQIDKYDPENVHPELFGVKKNYKEILEQFNYTLSQAHELFFNKGLNLYNKQNLAEAKTAFEKSLYYQNNFAPSQYFLALIAFDLKKTDESKQQLTKLFAFKNIDESTHKSALGLAYSLEWIDLNNAAAMLTQQKYEEALQSAVQAESFCKSIPSFVCSDTIELIRRDSYNGIYNQYMQTAENSYNLKKIDKAEGEVNKAIGFQKQHTKYITNITSADNLLEKIKIEQYYNFIAKGNNEMNIKSYRDAFDDFKKASALEQVYDMKKDKQLPELIKSSKREILFLSLADAEGEVASNDLNSARKTLTQVIDDQKEYNLISDTKLSQKVESLKKSIFSQECTNAQRDYDNNIASAESAALGKQFIQSESFYNQALQIVKSNYNCDINDNQATTGLKLIEKPAHYQKDLNECTQLAKDYKYTQSIDAYNKLTAYYNENVKELSGIQHQNLRDYIATFEYGFLLQGVTWFTNNSDLENGFALLKVLRQRNLNKSLCKLQQQSLAVAFALRDFKSGAAQNAKLKVTEYTLDDSWFSFFSKEYLKQLKKMK